MPRKPKLPETTDDVLKLSGAGKTLRSLGDIHKVQKTIEVWLVEAAEERWPDLLNGQRTEDEVLKMIWENAKERWEHIDSLAIAINDGERVMYRSLKALA